jgi:hypothetical protein
MDKERYYVITKDSSEFLDFLSYKSHADRARYEYIRIYHSDHLRGILDPHGCFYGNWKENPDIRNILLKMMTCYSSTYHVPAAITVILSDIGYV